MATTRQLHDKYMKTTSKLSYGVVHGERSNSGIGLSFALGLKLNSYDRSSLGMFRIRFRKKRLRLGAPSSPLSVTP